LRLIDFAPDHTVTELLQQFLDEAELLTESRIGFYHYVENDQESLSLQTWSTNTLQNMCTAEGEGLHYPISGAGVWVDAFHRRQPVVFNDYESLSHKKGLPDGHATINRILVVPVVRGNMVVAILGVGNKATDYNQVDISTVQQFADQAWETVVRRKAEERIHSNERFLTAIVENIPNMIFVKDARELRFVRFNRAGEELVGFSREELMGKNDYDFFKKQEADFFTDKDRKVLESCEILDIPEEPIKTKAKGERILHTIKIPVLDENGNPEYLLGISEDITERRQLEAQIRQKHKMESIGTLAGGIAHDFNNILFPILGLAELLLDDLPADSPARTSVKRIMVAGNRGADLVKQILTFSRRSERKLVPLRLPQMMAEALQLARSTIPANIELSNTVQSDCGLVEADPSQIHQVIMNLITNAFHAVEQEGGKIELCLRQENLSKAELPDQALMPGNYVILSVIDTGPGIAPELQEVIFEPYFTTKEQGKGTGLGLAVVYGIVKEHKGGIDVISKQGQGTNFNVYLPLLEDIPESVVDKDQARRQEGTERILIVDDEEPIAELESEMLRRLGYTVTMTTSPLQALDIFKAAPDQFDLILTDMAMPGMTGDNLAAELVAIKPDIPIIMVTGFNEMMDKKQVGVNGVRDILMKPMALSELAEMVRSVLD